MYQNAKVAEQSFMNNWMKLQNNGVMNNIKCLSEPRKIDISLTIF